MKFIVVIFILFSINLFSETVLILNSVDDILSLKDSGYYFEDKSGKLELIDILKTENREKFQKLEVDYFSRPATESAFWFKFQLNNQTKQDSWLVIATAFAGYIDFYILNENNELLNSIYTGLSREESSKIYKDNWFWLPLDKSNDLEIKTYYFRIKESSPFEAPFKVGTFKTLSNYKSKNDYLAVGFIGFMLALILYNLFILISTRDKLYGIYLGYLIGYLFTTGFLNGYSFIHIFSFGLFEISWWLDFFEIWQAPVHFAAGYFCVQFLNLKKKFPNGRILVYIELFILSVLFPILNLFIPQVKLITPYQASVFLFYISCVSISYILVYRGNKEALYYAIGWSFFLFGVVMIIFVINSIIPYHFLLRNFTYFGCAIEGIIFSFALVAYINRMREEKESALIEVNEKRIENEKIIKEQNFFLEQKVKERTIELENKKQILEESEIKLNEAKLKAEDSSKSKSIFLANMSHEIRTPINGILGMSRILFESKLDLEQSEQVKTIISSGENLLSIINDILDFSKIEAGKIELEKLEFDLNELILSLEKVMSLISKAKNLDLIFETNFLNEKYLIGDPLRLKQVLINLINNAIKFTSSGFVKVRIKTVNEENNFSKILFEIIDTGIGISEKNQSRLFQSFSQADASTTREFGGTGLGLTISQNLVELMNGKIELESEMNKGSKFSFLLKLEKGNLIQTPKVEVSNSKDLFDASKFFILVVEDNEVNMKINLKYLEKFKSKVDSALNGKEALLKLENKNFDLILMDCQMPILDGFQTTKIIRETNQDIIIIALTANAMKEDKEKCLEAGMNDYLSKPFKLNDLEKILKTWLS